MSALTTQVVKTEEPETETENDDSSSSTTTTPPHACAGCGKPAAMACPSCVKLKQSEPSTGLSITSSPNCLKVVDTSVAYYCAQSCFKEHWAQHKKKHKPWAALIAATKQQTEAETQESTKKRDEMPPEFRNYDNAFTGTLRPWARGTSTEQRLRALPKTIKKPDYWATGDPVSEKNDKSRSKGIKVYSELEIKGIRRACAVGRQVLDACKDAVKVGATTDEIDRVCFEACVERSAYPSPLNYYNFPCSVCTSVNEVVCHGIPDQRELQDGDIVNVDVSVFVDGYHGDLNETYLVGSNCSDDSKRLVECAFKCLAAAANLVKPGTYYRDVGPVIDKVARQCNCSVVRTYCGHGIGDLFHTSPNVPHYAKNKAVGVMKPGHIFTIEPMINLGSWRDKTWPDNWTAVTIDGKRSAQFEHTFLVTDSGYEILTMRDNEPKMVWDLAKQQR